MGHTLIIAEVGVNHNGSLEAAKKLCDAAKECGADVVKFQTWITDKIITREVARAKYQQENTQSNKSQYEMLKELEMSFDDFVELKSYCDKIGITFASTADEVDSLDFLINLGIPFIKIGSGEICNIPFLREVGKRGLPVILSTGMSTTEEIRLSVDTLKENGLEDITLLHCTTNYPCSMDTVNLLAMKTLEREFGYRVGYSDHTIGIEVPVAAVSLGATVIEKHFTLDRTMSGPDHIASMEPCDFARMVSAIRNVETALGDGVKAPTIAEKDISKVVRKRIVANRAVSKGQTITEDDICVKRSDNGLEARFWDAVIGKTAIKDFIADEGIVF